MIARPVPLASRHTKWVVAAMLASLLAMLGLVPIDRVVTTPGCRQLAVTAEPLSRSANSRVNMTLASLERA